MKALVFREMGSLSKLKLEEVPNPSAGPGEVVVELRNASINPSDYKNVLGKLPSTTVPRIPGRDFAGVVIAGPSKWLGKEVFGMGGDLGIRRNGSHAQQVVVPVELLVEKPSFLSHAQAAAMSLGYLAAWSALVNAGQLKDSETILITGTTGAVGSAAVSIAKFKGAQVIGTLRNASERNRAAHLPVDQWIVLDEASLTDAVSKLTGGQGVEMILDLVGGALFEPCLQSLAHHGRQIAMASTGGSRVSFDLVDFYHRQNHLIGVDTTKLSFAECAAILKALLPGFKEGFFQAPEIEFVSLEEACGAYEQLSQGKIKKKLVIDFQ